VLKGGVRPLGIRPEVLLAHIEVRSIFREIVGYCVVTCGMEGKHSIASLHYAGNALDYRANTILDNTVRDTILNRVRSDLGYPDSDYDFILEVDEEEPENDHFHLEYQPKRSY